MSEQSEANPTKESFEGTTPSESQLQRWLKYGLNVAMSTIIVICLAWALVWLGQAHSGRFDTTTGGVQSLRPQSVQFIQGLKQKVTIVGLYPKLKSESKDQDLRQPVVDLLNEYSIKSDNITTQVIDPDVQTDEFNKLVDTVTKRYGGEIKGYKAITDEYPTENKQLVDFTSTESADFKKLAESQLQNSEDVAQQVNAAYLTLKLAQAQLSQLKNRVDTNLEQKIPSYNDAVDEIKSTYSSVSEFLVQYAQVMDAMKDNAALSKEVHDYATAAEKRAGDATLIATGLIKKIQALPPLKELIDFKSQLQSKSILVMTDHGYKILQPSVIWKMPEQSRFVTSNSGEPPKLIFAGEQSITAAIASLTAPKPPLVVFVRPGGPPLTSANPEGASIFSGVADRLRDDNFDVKEKDASGQWAMQAQQQQQEMPVEEATPEEMKSAVWVVVRFPEEAQMQEPSSIDAMLADHVKNGGAALVMPFPTIDPMDSVLLPMGIKAKTDYMLVHEQLPQQGRRITDRVEAAFQATQAVVKFNELGNHPITNPLAGLELLQYGLTPISTVPNTADVKVTPLLPVPFTPHYWATSTPMPMLTPTPPTLVYEGKADPSNDHPIPDLDNTEENQLYGAAAAERKDGTRLVVVGSYQFATSDLVDLADQDNPQVARLPANGEFFVNSVLWLAHEDAMLAVGPHALQVARVKDLSPGSMIFWRLGVLTAGLPLAVIALGLIVWVNRRD